MSIILTKSGNKTVRLDREMIRDENYLQKYVSENPMVLPLSDIRDDFEMVILAREFPTLSGPIDILAIDDQSRLNIIETKLYRNPDKRLVLAQILDYGASLWSGFEDSEQLVNHIQDITLRQKERSLENLLSEELGLSNEEVPAFLQDIHDTYASDGIRYIVLMDQIDDRLKNLISYINANSAFEVVGVQLDYYRHEDLQLIIPKLYGADRHKKAPAATGASRRKWDETTFFKEAEQHLKKEVLDKVKQLYSWSLQNADQIKWGTGSARGSFNPAFKSYGNRSLFSVYTDGELHINFAWHFRENTDPEFVQRFAKNLVNKRVAELPDDFLGKNLILNKSEWMDKVDIFVNSIEEALSD